MSNYRRWYRSNRKMLKYLRKTHAKQLTEFRNTRRQARAERGTS